MPVTRTTTATLYSFSELSEKAQDNAIERLYDLNVDYNWGEYIYEDAARIGLEITEFDLGHRRTIDGKLSEYLLDCCKLIRKNHGKDCDTFKTAKHYLTKYIESFKKTDWSEDLDDATEAWKAKDWLYEFKFSDQANEITEEFRKAILEDYLSILSGEYEYQTSREAIVESIEANEYLFTEDGVLA